MEIGNTLRKLRESKKLSQGEVATFLNISRQAYCRYENNQREPSLDVVCKLATYYDETTDTILGREPL